MASFFTKKIVGQFFKDVAKGSQRFRELSDAEAQRDQELEARNKQEQERQDRADERARLQREQSQASENARIKRERDKATKAGDKDIREGAFKAEESQLKARNRKTDAAAKVKAAKTLRAGQDADREDRQKHDLEKAGRTSNKKTSDKVKTEGPGEVTKASLFDKFSKLNEDQKDGLRVKSFEDYIKLFQSSTGLKAVDQITEEPEPVDPSAGHEEIKQAAFEAENQRPNLISTGNQGVDLLNQIATGRNLPQIQPETGTATDFDDTGFEDPNRLEDFQDQLPAEFPPDFPVIPGTDTGDGSIDLTSVVDPSFHVDPQRSEAAAFATELLSKDEFGLLTAVEEAWLEAYLEATELGGVQEEIVPKKETFNNTRLSQEILRRL